MTRGRYKGRVIILKFEMKRVQVKLGPGFRTQIGERMLCVIHGDDEDLQLRWREDEVRSHRKRCQRKCRRHAGTVEALT